jgi:hypothetical protein
MNIQQIGWPSSERALGVQAGLTSIANVVDHVMVGGARSTSARGLRCPARRRGRG